MLNKLFALLILVIGSPVLLISFSAIKLTSPGPFIFKQKRMGKDKKVFTMYKMRTMINHAATIKKRYLHLNEADGPVFKIRNDPRLTSVGKFLARTGLDELPQLVNVIGGDMALVGPRPLPVDEARLIPKKYQERFSVLPGITSPWVVYGAHKLNFTQWMELDLKYIKKKSTIHDNHILLLTLLLMLRNCFPKKSTEKITKAKAA